MGSRLRTWAFTHRSCFQALCLLLSNLLAIWGAGAILGEGKGQGLAPRQLLLQVTRLSAEPRAGGSSWRWERSQADRCCGSRGQSQPQDGQDSRTPGFSAQLSPRELGGTLGTLLPLSPAGGLWYHLGVLGPPGACRQVVGNHRRRLKKPRLHRLIASLSLCAVRGPGARAGDPPAPGFCSNSFSQAGSAVRDTLLSHTHLRKDISRCLKGGGVNTSG